MGVPPTETLEWMRLLIARRFDSLFHSEALTVVTGYHRGPPAEAGPPVGDGEPEGFSQ